MTSVLSRIEGGLLGVAAGDSLGAPLEGKWAADIRRRYGTFTEIIGTGYWRPGEPTDDTELTWAVANGYLTSDGSDLIERVADGFLKWFRENGKGIGGATRKSLGLLSRTGDPYSSGLTGDKDCGNGSLMRTIPTGLVRLDPEVRMVETAAISAITHAHQRCIDSCVAYNEIVAMLLLGAAPAEAIAHACAMDLRSDVIETLEIPPEVPVTELQTGGYVLHSLGCAAWAIQQDGSFEDIVVALVNMGWDADTTGAIAGGLLGVRDGVESIPERWLSCLEYGPRLKDAAARFAAIRN